MKAIRFIAACIVVAAAALFLLVVAGECTAHKYRSIEAQP